MPYNFDEIINRRGTNAVKVDIFEPDVISLWVADMDFRAPQPIVEAIKARADHG
ncbi:MAG: aminotransferase, partial [Chloroflexi bacterium]